MADTGGNKAWQRRTSQSPAQHSRNNSNTRGTNKEGNMATKAGKPPVPLPQKTTSPAPPMQNPWAKGSAAIKGNAPATQKAASPSTTKKTENTKTNTGKNDTARSTQNTTQSQSLIEAQRIDSLNTSDIHAMFAEDAKRDLASLGPAGFINLGDSTPTPEQIKAREPATMADGKTNFFEDLAKQLADMEKES